MAKKVKPKKGWTLFTPPLVILNTIGISSAADDAAKEAAKLFQKIWKEELTNTYPTGSASHYGVAGQNAYRNPVGSRKTVGPNERIARRHRKTGVWHAASAPGEKPAKETGATRTSIRFREVEVTSNFGQDLNKEYHVFTFDPVTRFLEAGTVSSGGPRPHLLFAIARLNVEAPPAVLAVLREGIKHFNFQPLRRQLQKGISALGTLQSTGLPFPKFVGLSRVWALKFSRGLDDLDAFGGSIINGTDALPRRAGRRIAGRRMGLLLQEMIPPQGGGQITRFGKRIIRTRVGRGTGAIIQRL